MKVGALAGLVLVLSACGPEATMESQPQTPVAAAPKPTPVAPSPNDPEVHPSFEEGPNRDLAQGWFYQNHDNGSWCGFSDLAKARRYVDTALAAGTNHQGWLTTKDGRLETITELNFSEDAYAEDRYFFEDQKIIGLKRSGRVINARQATYAFAPDASGNLALSAAGKKVVADIRGDIDMYYIVDWPRRSKVEEFPYFALLDNKDGKVSVRQACTPATGPVDH